MMQQAKKLGEMDAKRWMQDTPRYHWAAELSEDADEALLGTVGLARASELLGAQADTPGFELALREYSDGWRETVQAALSRTPINLTDKAPVRIIDEHWPMLRDFEGGNDTLANPWSWRMFVRHHSDGRTLVYGWCEPFSSNDRFRYAGELVSAGGDVAMAVRRVGTALHANPDDITQCITELPAEDLD